MEILEEIMSTEQENVVGGLSSTSADSEIAMEYTEPRNSIDISVQCNLVAIACHTVETQTENDRGLYEVITDEDVLDSSTNSLSSVDCSDRAMEEEECSLSNEEETDSVNEVAQLPVSERKFIVYEERLDQLLCCCLCPWCKGPATSASKRFFGSMVVVNLTCLNGHKHSGQSQPCINGRPEGNLLIAVAIYTIKWLHTWACQWNERLLRVSFIGKSLFYALQEKMLFPIVVQAWKINQALVINSLHQVGSVDLCGNGRCDSPGHSAKYGTHTLLDDNTGKIPAFSVVQVTEVTSSSRWMMW